MKTSAEMLELFGEMIAMMHNRIVMYVGSTEKDGAADTIDVLFYQIHFFWAEIQERLSDLSTAQSHVQEKHDCGILGFAGTFRERNPEATEKDASRFVMDRWKEIDAELGIDTEIAD